MDDLFLNVEEFAAREKVNPETVRRWCRAGKVKGQLTKTQHGMQYMIPVSELNTIQDAEIIQAPQLPAAVVDQLAKATAAANIPAITEAIERLTTTLPHVVEAAVEAKTAPLREDNRQLRALVEAGFRRQDEKIAAAIPNRQPEKEKDTLTTVLLTVTATVCFMAALLVGVIFLAKH